MTRYIHLHPHDHSAARSPKRGHPYRPSQFDGDYLTPQHQDIHQIVEAIEGQLQTADELKLYEMAYLARGPILEIGRYEGKSLAILATATRDAGSGNRIYSIDKSDHSLEVASANLDRIGLLDSVTLVQGDSSLEIDSIDDQFDLVFVDGNHTYEGVLRDLIALQGRVVTGGSIAFHDYFDSRNDDPVHRYGVSRAVAAKRDELRLRFCGGYGALALFEQL